MFFRKKIKVATHDGGFHADEVFACAALSLWAEKKGEKIKIIRTRDERIIKKADIVVDVGMEYDPAKKRYDHHQKGGAGEHVNSIPFASFGLVWKHYGEEICESADTAKLIENMMVVPIDADDNGVNLTTLNYHNFGEYTAGSALESFNPTWRENPNIVDDQFEVVVDLARQILRREIIQVTGSIIGEQITREAIKAQHFPKILVLDEYVYWENAVVAHKEVKVVVYRHKNNRDWAMQVARDDLRDFTSNRASLPEEWDGHRDGELERISGIAGASFSARGGWFAVAKTKEGAIEMAKRALGKQ